MKYFFIRWIVIIYIAFFVYNNQFFKDLFKLFLKTLVEYLSLHINTIRD